MDPILLIFLAYAIRLSCEADWCYQSQVACNGTCIGPSEWWLLSEQCAGRAQSPVNVVTRTARLDTSLTPLELIGYQETFHGRISNNGHSVQVDLPSSARVKGGKLEGEYKAVALHFHWGEDGGPGSEHTIDGEQFAMEMHIIHIKEEYETLDQALEDNTGVAVLAFFFQEYPTPNKQYNPVISALDEVIHSGSNSSLEGVSLGQLILPNENLTRYFRYQGSLTTPACQPAVVWTLFEEPIRLSRKQLSAFNGLWSGSGSRMVNTYRPVQPLNIRQVYYSAAPCRVMVTPALLISAMLLSSGLSLTHTTG